MKTLQRTLTIIKPDAVKKNAVGDIIEQFEKNGFHILAMKMLKFRSIKPSNSTPCMPAGRFTIR